MKNPTKKQFVPVTGRSAEAFRSACQRSGLAFRTTFGLGINWTETKGLQGAVAVQIPGELEAGLQVDGDVSRMIEEATIQFPAIETSLTTLAGEPLMVTTIEVVTDKGTAQNLPNLIADDQVRLILDDQITNELAQATIRTHVSSLKPADMAAKKRSTQIQRTCLIGFYYPRAERGNRLPQLVQVTGIPGNAFVRQVVTSGAFNGLEVVGNEVSYIPATAVISTLKDLKSAATTASFEKKGRVIAMLQKPAAYAGKVEYVTYDEETGRWTIKQTLILSETGELNQAERRAVGLNLRNILKGGNAMEAWSYGLDAEQPNHIGEAAGAVGVNAYFQVDPENGTAKVLFSEEPAKEVMAA